MRWSDGAALVAGRTGTGWCVVTVLRSSDSRSEAGRQLSDRTPHSSQGGTVGGSSGEQLRSQKNSEGRRSQEEGEVRKEKGTGSLKKQEKELSECFRL